MTEFGELVQNMNGNGQARLTREEQLEILAAIDKPKNIQWTQKDLDETLEFIFKAIDDQFKSGVLPAIAKFIESRVAPLRERIDELEHRTENFKYVGVYESGETYALGNFCTHNGSLWHCQSDTTSVPGTDASWVLCVKRGKDAR